MARPPAPASDATLAAAPPHIPVDSVWDDAEWRAVAARPNKNTLTETQKYLWAGGPRPHPWGAAAYQGDLPDGRKAYFPSKDAYDKFMAADADDQAKAEARGQMGLAALNAGLAAHAHPDVVEPTADPKMADKLLEAASPNGSVATP